jgi:hypothetical protein
VEAAGPGADCPAGPAGCCGAAVQAASILASIERAAKQIMALWVFNFIGVDPSVKFALYYTFKTFKVKILTG